MNEANGMGEQDEASALAGARVVARMFEPLVSPAVHSPAERDLHGGVLALLTGAGLLSTAASSLLALSGFGLGPALAALGAAGLFLGGAGALCAGGRLSWVGSGFAAALAGAGLWGVAAGGAAAVPGAGALGAAVLGGVWLARRGLAGRKRRRLEVREREARESAALHRLLPGPLLRFDLDGRPLPGNDDTLPLDRIHMHDRVAFLSAFAELRRGASTEQVEVRTLPIAGEEERVLLLHLACVESEGGAPASVIGTLNDRTAIRLAERRLAGKLEKAEAGSEAKSRFLADISHELRTPLNAIIGFTDILEREYFGGFESARQKEYVGLIARSGEHLLQVVNGLLDISKIEAGRYEIAPEPFVLSEAMAAAAAMVEGEARRKGLVLVVQEPAEGTMFVADPRAFHQMLLNLLSNAVKFTDKGSVRLSARLENGQQLVEVEDTGSGIAAGDLARVTEPFVQLGRDRPGAQPGTGLGLSLVKGLCELHGGRLRLESREGVGTTAVIAIPADCATAAAPQIHPEENIVSLTDARKKTSFHPQTRPDRRSA